jgi:hypothetical protein
MDAEGSVSESVMAGGVLTGEHLSDRVIGTGFGACSAILLQPRNLAVLFCVVRAKHVAFD